MEEFIKLINEKQEIQINNFLNEQKEEKEKNKTLTLKKGLITLNPFYKIKTSN